MVYYGVTPPYPSPTHPAEGDESSRDHRYCNVLKGYTRRDRDIGRIDTCVVPIGQYNNAVIRYGEGEIHV
jgi:hypothetical protein